MTYEPAAELLSPQEMYHIACIPVHLPDNFAKSLRAYVFFLERGHEVYDYEMDNRYSPVWGTALRSAIGQAEEWIIIGDHLFAGRTILRRIATELCRDSVPREERIL